MKKYEARIIGETSAGLTALEIYVNNELYWTQDYFSQGAVSSDSYNKLLRTIYDDAMDCDTVEDWAEFEYDADENPIIEIFNNSNTTWTVAIYTPENGWIFNDPENDGQSYDFIKTNADRIPKDVLDKWKNLIN